MAVGKRWTEEETKLALFLYFQLPFGKLHSGTPEIKQLAEALGRTPSSVAMKLSNFASLDPKIIDSGRKGLDGASKLDRQVFTSFQSNWTSLVDESERLWTSAVELNEVSILRDQLVPYRVEPFEGKTTVTREVEQRVGQNFFRRAVLANFDEQCCITGIADVRLLNASHIVPWGSDVENRHNPANGLALSATFDRAFDRGLITVNPSGLVLISNQLLASKSEDTVRFFSPYQTHKIAHPIRISPDPELLNWHNNHVYVDADPRGIGAN
jgi:putative restriction endonuclease